LFSFVVHPTLRHRAADVALKIVEITRVQRNKPILTRRVRRLRQSLRQCGAAHADEVRTDPAIELDAAQLLNPQIVLGQFLRKADAGSVIFIF